MPPEGCHTVSNLTRSKSGVRSRLLLLRALADDRSSTYTRPFSYTAFLNTMTTRTLCTALLFGAAAFAQTVTDTFAAAKLSGREVREIIAGVEQSAYDTPTSWETELRVRRVDLGGSSGLVVRGTSLLCGATGNCQMWVFRKTNEKW